MARSNTGSSSNYFSCAFSSASVPISIALWFNVAGTSTEYDVVCVSTSGTNNHLLALNDLASGKVSVETTDNGGSTGTSSSTTFTANTWNHAAGVFASTTSRIAYLNGIAGTADTTNKSIAALASARIGASPGGPLPINGSMAEVAIWNIALTATDVRLLASGVSPLIVRPDSLLAYWPMTGLNYASEPDILGGHPLTMTGVMGVSLTQQLVSGWLNTPKFVPIAASTIGAFSAAGSSTATWAPVAPAFSASGFASSTFNPSVAFSAAGSASTSLVGQSNWIAALSASGSSIASWSPVVSAFSATGAASASFSPSVSLIASAGSSAVLIPVVNFAAAGGSSASLSGSSLWAGSFEADGSSTTSLVGSSLWVSSFEADGTSSLTASPNIVFTAAGAATTSLVGSSLWSGAFTDAGSSSTALTPVVNFTAAGTSSAAWTGTAVSSGSGTFTAVGSSTASFVGQSNWIATFVASGSATASFDGQSQWVSTFAAPSAASATFNPALAFSAIGSSLALFSPQAKFSAAGDSVATFDGQDAERAEFHAAGDSTAAFYSTAGSAANGSFTAAGDSQAVIYPIIAFQAQGSSSVSWNGLAGTVQQGSFSATGSSAAQFSPVAKFQAVGDSNVIAFPIVAFRASGTSSFTPTGQSTWESSFEAVGDSEANFIRFIPKVTPNPSRITPGTTVTLTLYGQGTYWTSGAPSLSAPGLTFSNLTVVSDTEVTVTAEASHTPQVTTVTDSTTGSTTSILIKKKVAWVPPRRA